MGFQGTASQGRTGAAFSATDNVYVQPHVYTVNTTHEPDAKVEVSAPNVSVHMSASQSSNPSTVSAAASTASNSTEVVSVWHRELSLLANMGFNDQDVLLPLLKKHCEVPASRRKG